VIPRITEDTVTGLLAEELEKRGVKVQLFPLVNTPKGLRKPDAVCVNAGSYIVEAKFRERDLFQAVAKIQNDYLKFYKIIGLKGGFALLYPHELSKPMSKEQLRKEVYRRKFKLITIFPPEDSRNFSVIEGHIGEIANVIAEHVLTPPSYVEPSVPYIIETLRQAAQHIVEGLRHLTGQQLEEFFGGKHVFQNILQYEEQKYPLEDLRLAAAYILVNQLLFYHVLSAKRPDMFPPIDPDGLKSPSELKNYFERALVINYKPVFQYDACSLIPIGYLDHIRTIINAIKGIAPEKVGGDLLGTIFHDLVPFEVRKSVAAFYTNVLAAELLAWLAIDNPDAKVADLACGSGGLLVAAYRRKKFLAEQLKRKFTYEDHKKFVEKDLLGIDVMPFAASVAACHLSLQSPEYFTDKVQIGIWDSTELKPGNIIPTIAGVKYILRGQASLDSFDENQPKVKGVVKLSENEREEKIKLEKYDVIIMNPPFTRHERIPKEYKKLLEDRFSDYKDKLHGQLGYYGYFVLLADRFLKDGGRLALVLPATLLRVKSCQGIRKLLAEKYHVEHIITTWHRSAFSESARFREILLIAQKSQPNDSKITKITILKQLPQNISEARDVADLLNKCKEPLENDNLILKICEFSKLKKDVNNWFKYIAVNDLTLIDILENLLSNKKLILFDEFVSLGNYNVLRGIETAKGVSVQALTITQPNRAIKKSDIWIVMGRNSRYIHTKNRFLSHTLRIPLHAVEPALRRVSLVDRVDITDTLDYVIVERFENEREYFRLLKMSLPEVREPSNWNNWRNYVRDRLSNLALVRRIDLSAPGTRALAFYSDIPFAPPGVAWSIKAGIKQSKILSLWFNSTLFILQLIVNRKETRGAFLQLDEYALKELAVPDLRNLSESDISMLLNTFEKIRQVKLPSILEQLQIDFWVRRTIDTTWLKIFGYSDNEINQLLSYIYPAVVRETSLLKQLMAEGKEVE